MARVEFFVRYMWRSKSKKKGGRKKRIAGNDPHMVTFWKDRKGTANQKVLSTTGECMRRKYVYVCVCVHLRMCVWVFVSVCTCMFVCVCEWTRMYALYMCVWLRGHVWACRASVVVVSIMCIHIRRYMVLWAFMCVYVFSFIRVSMYELTCMRMCSWVCVCVEKFIRSSVRTWFFLQVNALFYLYMCVYSYVCMCV